MEEEEEAEFEEQDQEATYEEAEIGVDQEIGKEGGEKGEVTQEGRGDEVEFDWFLISLLLESLAPWRFP